ncbi:MAG: site-2 protease family protein [Candidatus Omnitrophota bacterium]|nr:site-2 protease family protein [bacterium]MBU3930134.1 site-2 protease family protein [bacterium]MBU4123034.1 site-2 protease family protein [bacterium]
MLELLFLPILFFSVIVHEVAHGYAALRLGDETALYSGRLTLNPIPHIDPVGTIILPLFLFITNAGFLIGWAKPVPVNPYNFVNPRQDFAKVGAAGPLANIALALISAMLLTIINLAGLMTSFELIAGLLQYSVFINILLAVFNLIPIPPLDGSRILAAVLPYDKAYKYERMMRFGPFLTLIVLWMFWPVIFTIVRTIAGTILSVALSI